MCPCGAGRTCSLERLKGEHDSTLKLESVNHGSESNKAWCRGGRKVERSQSEPQVEREKTTPPPRNRGLRKSGRVTVGQGRVTVVHSGKGLSKRVEVDGRRHGGRVGAYRDCMWIETVEDIMLMDSGITGHYPLLKVDIRREVEGGAHPKAC